MVHEKSPGALAGLLDNLKRALTEPCRHPFRLDLAQRQAVSAYGSLLERLRDRTPVMVIASIRLL